MTSREFRTSRMVLRQHPAEEAVAELADKNSWPLVEELGSASESRREVVWQAWVGTTVHYVEDQPSSSSYIYAKGDQPNLTTSTGGTLEEELKPWRLLDLWRRVDVAKDPVRLGLALLKLGVGAPYTYEEGTFERIQRGLTHQDERTRDMSLWATTYSPWPEYRPTLEDIAAYDPVPTLRERASLTLEAYDAAGVDGS
ncbi:hypothetical protein [Saccharothrix luteola]|uniref:hypothetical protein n=1 Tax=Saccharothrix luteola TaxID=2893018 RepID=UPI001E4B4B3F|nr:hypothetical protein [Saccharothrix luteola]MCC8250477.1 hypothetical protein [Saccharothrix luteola]